MPYLLFLKKRQNLQLSSVQIISGALRVNAFVILTIQSLSFVECMGRLYTCIWASTREKCLRGFANNTGADQPAHKRSLISTFVIRLLLHTGKISIF